jgi:hypothetical protein
MAGGYANIGKRGYGLVVERVLAKDETGVRFSLSALKAVRTTVFDAQQVSTYKNGSIEPFLYVFWFCGEVCINLLTLGIKDKWDL